MKTPITTGQAADLLHSTEPKLGDLVRRKKVYPPPRVLAGRRLWETNHLLQAARALGVLTPELREILEKEGTNG